MSETLQTNVFFAITSIAVVVFTIFVCVALYYLIRILKNVRDVTDRLKRGSEQLAEDAQAVRSFIHEGVIGSVRASFGKLRASSSSSAAKRKKGGKNMSDLEDDDASY